MAPEFPPQAGPTFHNRGGIARPAAETAPVGILGDEAASEPPFGRSRKAVKPQERRGPVQRRLRTWFLIPA